MIETTRLSNGRVQPASREDDYAASVSRFLRLVEDVVPAEATVLVVSKGDSALLRVEQRRAWHFPQRSDGVYAGYHPADSDAAIGHLDALCSKGAEFLAIPPASAWWLDHYAAFGRHLEQDHRLIVRDEDAGQVYALCDGQGSPLHAGFDVAALPVERPSPAPSVELPPTVAVPSLEAVLEERLVDDALMLIDEDHYGEQVGQRFATREEALSHYLLTASETGASPHPLFDREWYLQRYPGVRATGSDPLVHFLRNGSQEGNDPSPFFDSDFYYSQRPHLRQEGVNALVHYLRHSADDAACAPNPLFRDAFYRRNHPELRDSALTPLEHYLSHGWGDGRAVSPVHQSMLATLSQSSRSALVRGHWRRGTILLLTSGSGRAAEEVLALAAHLARDHHVDSVVVARERVAIPPEWDAAKSLVLDDFAVACDVLRPSALRLVVKSLAALRPLLAVVESPEFLDGLSLTDVPVHFLLDERAGLPPAEDLRALFERSDRVFVASTATFHACARALGDHPTNVALRDDRPHGSAAALATRLLGAAAREHGVEVASGGGGRGTRSRGRQVVIPCSDWNVSGVNASLEAIGRELIRLGWDVRILFTRSREAVLDSAQDQDQLPLIPYDFLERRRPGIEGMWEALIAELEGRAPCVAFMAYDFLANGVVSALTDRVGTVMWVQADDGDYYEQVYRLGRYCDEIVCVSEHIRGKVSELNPALAGRASVIHNSSVWEREVLTRRSPRTSGIRIVYSGRLVQYQKRVLDFIELARALDRTGVPYTINLIGSFSAREATRDRFLSDAAVHLADGRIALQGRLSRQRILEQLDRHDFFVLLSDFEGLPLALVEGMARGCVPVVPEMSSGIPEILTHEENGLIMATRDYDEWAEHIVALCNDRRRLSRMSQRARATVRSAFTVDRMARRFDELFTRVLEEATAGTPRRPPALTWGVRSPTGDVLAPPSLLRPAAIRLAGLR